jgi:hypothetical protein
MSNVADLIALAGGNRHFADVIALMVELDNYLRIKVEIGQVREA